MTIRVQTVAVFMLWMMAAVGQTADYEIEAPGRVVAFGDVHGAYDEWVELLQEIDIVDADLNWIAGDTHLVSIGDLIDRGPGSRDVVRLMMQLERQAEVAGGDVHMILGNHEVLVLTDDLSYVSPAEFAAFAEDESAEQRNAAFDRYSAQDSNEARSREAFDKAFPPGYFALREAYSPDGDLGAWLLKQPFALKVNDIAFLHGGIAYADMKYSIKELNERLQSELQNYVADVRALEEAQVLPPHIDFEHRLAFLSAATDAWMAKSPRRQASWFDPMLRLFDAQQSPLFDPDSPHNYRGTAWCHPYSEAFVVERLLKNAGARQLVIGHTPSRGQVIDHMEGRVLRLDTGMNSSVYGGRGAALVYGDGDFYVHYLGDTERRLPAVPERSLSRNMLGMDDAALEEFLLMGEPGLIEYIGTGVTRPKRVTLEKDDTDLATAFKYEDTHPGIQDKAKFSSYRNKDADRFIYDVAAYKLDRLLDLQVVPVTVPRNIEGDDGAISVWLTDTINERDRVQQNIPFSGYCSQAGQYRIRFVFDILVYNEDRNLTNILWTKDRFNLRLIDHSLAFRTKDGRPKQYKRVRVDLSDLFREKLASLNEASLSQALGAYLHPKQIDAILERRDELLEDAERP